MTTTGDLDTLVRFERPVPAPGPRGAGKSTWELVGTPEWANIQDKLPSRGETLAEGMTMDSRPARLRIRYRTGLDASMRVVAGDRVMSIISRPATVGRRQWTEFMVEDYSVEGGTA